MATVINFEAQYKKGKPLTVVKPGTQSRRFTHIDDTANACYHAGKQTKVDIIQSQTKKLFNFASCQNV